jgi:PAS domain S-box-containing protein
MANADGIIDFVNEKFTRMTGYEPDEAIGQSLWRLQWEKTAPDFVTELQQLLVTQGEWHREMVSRRKNGEPYRESFSIAAVRDRVGAITAYVALKEDISQRKQCEEKLPAREEQAKERLEAMEGGGLLNVAWETMERKRSEDALRESEERYRQLFTNMTEGFAIGEARLTDDGLPCDFVLLDVNPAFERHTGLSREIVGKSARETLPQMEAHWVDTYCTVAMTGKSTRFQSYNKDTDRFYDIYAYSPARGRFAIIASDISDRKKAEDALRVSEEKFRSFFEHAAVGMGRVSFTDARWIDVNGAFCRMLGYSQEVMKATPWPHITHPEDLDLDLIPFRRMAAGKLDAYSVEKRFIHKEGHHVWARLTLSLVRNAAGLPDYEIAVIEDITDRKHSEAERERLLAEVQRSNQELQQFAYVASHDLQEPLRMISGYISLLDRKYRGELDEKGATYLGYVVDGASRMQKLIEGLLNYSRISREAGLVPVDTNGSLAAAVANLEQRIQDSGGVVTSDPLPIVLGDETQLVQLFQNLIGNGLKYQKPGSLPRVHLSARPADTEWLFSISDNGIGIESQNYGRIFQIFQRLHNREEYSGTGIGLALCKKIVERHGGKIWVESRPGEGSTFYFTLPGEH